jgi:hypothetical protein
LCRNAITAIRDLPRLVVMFIVYLFMHITSRAALSRRAGAQGMIGMKPV